jgi:ABC-type glutathione transport system ATPase component
MFQFSTGSNLDPGAQRDVLDLLQKFQVFASIIFVSHLK